MLKSAVWCGVPIDKVYIVAPFSKPQNYVSDVYLPATNHRPRESNRLFGDEQNTHTGFKMGAYKVLSDLVRSPSTWPDIGTRDRKISISIPGQKSHSQGLFALSVSFRS